jgi:hypothetical protein
MVAPDTELVHAARGGDPASLAALLTRHHAAMRAVAVSLLGWSADAEDAVQDAMLVALQRIGELRDPASVGPWLKAITRNNALMRRRAAGGHTACGLIESAALGEFRQTLAHAATPDLELIGPQRQRARGLGTLVSIVDSDLAAGVRMRPVRATAGRRITLLECELLSPSWDPDHCPPGVLWLLKHAGERIHHITLFHPEPAV